MEMRKLAISAQPHFGVPIEEQIRAFKKIGFEGFFTPWDKNLKKYRAVADEVGLTYIAVHGPTKDAASIWHKDTSVELIEAVHDTAEAGVPILILHAYIVLLMQTEAVPRDMEPATKEGIEHLRRVVEEAKACGVKIAFENAEGEDQLRAVFREFKAYDNVGFCWDSGHESAYASDIDYLSIYGDKLIITHLNDNLSCRDPEGKITGVDDLHLLPFDGVINWEEKMKNLKKYSLPEFLTFELKMNLPFSDKRHKEYENMTLKEYLTLAYSRASKIAKILEA